MEVRGPDTLVRRLPQPSHANGVRHFATVLGIRAGQKRKRHELCVATDGDSVTIYEAQNGQILTSYPVRPTSKFCCPPCTVRIAGSHGTPTTRQTYCAIEEDEPRLQCFKDISQPGQLQEPVTRNVPIKDTTSHILCLDTLPDVGKASNTVNLVVFQKHGYVTVYSEDLLSLRYAAQLASTPGSTRINVLCARGLSLEDASKSSLKQRPDVLSSLKESCSLLALVYVESDSQSQTAKFGLWPVDFTQPMSLQPEFVQPLLSHDLPRSENWLQDGNARIEFAQRASSISVGFTRGAATYDLKALTPHIISELSFDSPELSSTLQLSSSLVAGVSANTLKLYDSSYQSMQFSLDLTQTESKKRKRGSPNASGPVRFITYFAQLGRIIAARRNDLLAFDIRDTHQQNGESILGRPARLADCLALGVSSQVAASKDRLDDVEFDFGKVEWGLLHGKLYSNAVRKQLDQLAQDGDIEAFDNLAMDELQYHGSLTDIAQDAETETLPAPLHPVSEAEIRHLVSRVFRYHFAPESAESGSLEVVLPVRRVFSWLTLRGDLRRHEIQKHLSYGLNPPKKVEIRPGNMTRALIEVDPSLELLDEYIRGCGSSEVPELVEMINVLLKLIVEQAHNSTHSSPASDLSADRMEEEISHQLAVPFGPQGDSSSQAIQRHLSDEQGSGYGHIRQSLALVTSTLGTYSVAIVAARLRSSFNSSELLSLIQFLRQELFYGGYTFSHQQPFPVRTSSDHENLATRVALRGNAAPSLDAIVRLLSACIDAIGPVGFFTQGEDDDFIENMIRDLKSEIVRTTEAIEEASYLQGILRETVRYADSAAQRRGPHDQDLIMSDGVELPPKLGTIVTLYSEPDLELGDIDANGGMLPLSLRPDDVITKTKVRKGGGRVSERSAREMHMLQARQKGRYSFERLVL